MPSPKKTTAKTSALKIIWLKAAPETAPSRIETSRANNADINPHL